MNLYTSPVSGLGCSNFIASTATRPSGTGAISLNSSLNATLTAGQLYVLTISSFNTSTSFPTLPFNYNITFPSKPAGANSYNGVILPNNYCYTYAVLNTATNNIDAVSSTSNFSTLPIGSYQIYGASYYCGTAPPTPATPAGWVGSSLASITGGSTCQLFSSTNRPLTVSAATPVEFLSFQAAALNKSVMLTWETATEVNNKGFQIEKLNASDNGWDVLGFISGKGVSSNYEFVDNSPISINYYRLRQIDFDGQQTLSKIVSVAFKSTNVLKVYPTITNSYLNLEATNTANYAIFNLLGQIVMAGNVARRIDVSNLPEGTFIIKLGDEVAKFVKQ